MLDINNFLDSVVALIFIVFYWILLAQGAKRCHDIGNSGFFQLIPFYIFVMLFQEGESKQNKYGVNPKSKEFALEKRSVEYERVTHLMVIESMVTVLFAAVLLSINNNVFSEYDSYNIAAYLLMPVPAFFIFLMLSYYKKQTPERSTSIMKRQLVFSFIYYLVIRLYDVIFRQANVYIESILFELVLVALVFGLTFISVGIYYLFFKPSTKNA